MKRVQLSPLKRDVENDNMMRSLFQIRKDEQRNVDNHMSQSYNQHNKFAESQVSALLESLAKVEVRGKKNKEGR